EASRAGITDPVAQDRYYVSKTLHEIAQQPFGFVKLLARKTLWTIQAEESRDSHSYYFFTEQSPVLRVLPRMAVLFPLACMGILVLARRERFADRRSGRPSGRPSDGLKPVAYTHATNPQKHSTETNTTMRL